MSLQVEKKEGNIAILTIEVSTEDFNKAVDEAYQKNKKKIQIPGFRQGKASRQVIEKMYGKEVFFEDAANIIIPDAYEAAYKECEEEIVSAPKINVTQSEAGKPFIFTAEVALKPDVELGKYKGVEVDTLEVKVTDDEIDAAIETERKNSARTEAVTGRAAKDGDTCIIDFEGFVDEVAFEGGKGDNYPLTLGSGAFIPGFEEQIVGKNVDETFDVNVNFPEEYQAKELAGKDARFVVTLHEIKESILPELDDDFASDVSEYDTFAEYRESVKKNLEEKKAADVKTAKEDAAVEAVIEDAKMDIPELYLKTVQREMVDEFAQRLQMQGLSIEQYCQFTGATEAMLMEQTADQAERRIKTRLTMEAVAKAENIEVSDEDFEKEIEEMAKAYGMEAAQVKELLDEERTDMIKKDILINKAITFVAENAKEVKGKKKKASEGKEAKEEKAAKKTAKAKADKDDNEDKETKPKRTTKKAAEKKEEE